MGCLGCRRCEGPAWVGVEGREGVEMRIADLGTGVLGREIGSSALNWVILLGNSTKLQCTYFQR